MRHLKSWLDDLKYNFSKTGKLRTCSKIAQPHLSYTKKSIRQLLSRLDFLCFVSCVKTRIENREFHWKLIMDEQMKSLRGLSG